MEQLLSAVDENMLYRIFSACGSKTRLKLNKTGKDFNVAYVSYFTEVGANTAVERCNGRNIYGASISVIKLHASNAYMPEVTRSAVSTQNSQSIQFPPSHVGSAQKGQPCEFSQTPNNPQSTEFIQVKPVVAAQSHCQPAGSNSIACSELVNLIEHSQPSILNPVISIEAAQFGRPSCISVMSAEPTYPACSHLRPHSQYSPPPPTPQHSAVIRSSGSSSYMWFWRNDESGYSLYSDEHSEMITEKFLILS